MALRRITDGFVLEGLPADKPPAAENPFTTQAGTEFWPTDGSPPEITGYNGFGQIVWQPFNAGGGGGVVGVAGGAGIVITGPVNNPVVNLGFAGQQRGDLAYFDGATWVRFPIGTPGQLPLVNLFAGNNELFYRSLTSQEPAIADFTSGVSYDFRFGFAAQAQGDLCFSAGGAGVNWLRLPIGNAGEVLTVVGASPAWAPLPTPGVVSNWDLYVAPTGNDGNDGLTPATALRTINRAIELAPSSWIGQGVIHVDPGAYNVEPLWQWIVPTGVGTQRGVLLIDAPVQEVVAPQVATGGTAGAGQVFGQVILPGPFVPGALEGLILDCQTGPNVGQYRIIANGVTSIDIAGPFPAFSLLGETFRVIEETATITLPAPVPNQIALIAGQLGICFSGVKIDLNGNVFVAFCPLLFNLSSWRGTLGNGQVIVSQIGQFTLASPALVPTPVAGFSNCGPVCDFGMGALDGGVLRVGNGWAKQPLTAASGSKTQVENVYLTDQGGVLAIDASTARVQNLRANACNPPSQGIVMADRVSSLDVGFVDISACVGMGVVAANGSNVRGFSLLGGGNGGSGVLVHNHARMQIADANIGTFLSGALGDCQVGSNPAAATWAQIAAGAAADVLDLTAAVPTVAAVTTT